MWDMLKDEDVGNKLSLLLEFDRILGLGIAGMKKKELVKAPAEVLELLKKSDEVMLKRDRKLCDEDKIKEKWFLVLDTHEGQKIEKA